MSVNYFQEICTNHDYIKVEMSTSKDEFKTEWYQCRKCGLFKDLNNPVGEIGFLSSFEKQKADNQKDQKQ